jgi:hypothetical protein
MIDEGKQSDSIICEACGTAVPVYDVVSYGMPATFAASFRGTMSASRAQPARTRSPISISRRIRIMCRHDNGGSAWALIWINRYHRHKGRVLAAQPAASMSVSLGCGLMA